MKERKTILRFNVFAGVCQNAYVGVLLLTLLSALPESSALRSQPTWIQVPTPTTRTLRKVYFVDSLKGWVVGDSGTIMKTTNGGSSWIMQDSKLSTQISCIFMLNERQGWAVSVQRWSSPGSWYGTTMLRTTNGGDVWNSERFDSLLFKAVCFADSLHGCLGGEAGKLIWTADGGEHWANATVPPSRYSVWPIFSMKFVSPSTGYAVGGVPDLAGTIWKTTDQGQHWITFGLIDELLAFDASDSLNLLCVGGGYDDGAETALTTDGGEHWQFRFLGFPKINGQAVAVSFRTNNEVWTLLAGPGIGLHSLDSGNTWQLETIKKGAGLHDLMFTDERHGYVVGGSGLVLEYNTPYLLSVSRGWNIVSLPVIPSDYQKALLFPTSVSHAFAFSQAGYEIKDTLANHFGYWIKFPENQVVQIPSTQILSDTVPVFTGWNIVGSISAPLATTSIASDQPGMISSDFYGYANGYVLADTIQPGKGYWVKVNQAGNLIFPFLQTPVGSNRITIVPTLESPPPPPDTHISDLTSHIPTCFALDQNYPNPFNPATNFGFRIADRGFVLLKVFDVLGKEVATLMNEVKDPAEYTVQWKAEGFGSGVYYYRLEATSISGPGKSFVQVRKMLLLR